MAKHIVHVSVPGSSGEVACGTHGSVQNAYVREDVTCKICKRSEYFKALPNSKMRKAGKDKGKNK